MLEVKRSPAKVTWQVVYNGIVLESCVNKQEAQAIFNQLKGKVL